MSATHTAKGPPSTAEVWTAGDYDRLTTYGSAAEAAQLVRFAGIQRGQTVLDVGTGSGVVAIMAAQRGARATGIDPTPELLAKAKHNAAIAQVDGVVWKEGVSENLPFADATFDVVVSQFAHMFSPQPEGSAREMLRVLKPGGRLAFHAWVPEGYVGQMFALGQRNMPPMPGPPPPSPLLWGQPEGVRRYLGSGVRDLQFEHGALEMSVMSPAHARLIMEDLFGPTVLLVRGLAADPARLAAWRREYDAITAPFILDGKLRHEYLRVRATKA